jgi:PAS domain S-box-containing protein
LDSVCGDAVISVLYVDDEPGLLDLGRIYLEKEGDFSVNTCTSAHDALERLKSVRYDIIVSDYQMPEMDGIAFLKNLKASDNLTPFIIFTGKGREEIVVEALNNGAELSNKIRYAVSRRHTEEALAESERKFRGIFDTINDAVHIHEIASDGKPGTFIEVNEVACRMLQFTREELLRHGPLDFIAGPHSRPFDEIIAELSSTGHSIFETVHQRKDGTIVPVEINSHVVGLLGKQVMVSVVRDITQRKQAEDALRESEDRFRTLAAAAMEGIMIHDKGVIIDCNPQFAELFGYQPEEIKGRNGFDFMLAPESHDAISGWVRNGAKGTIDIIGIRKDGKQFYGETASTTILWQGKKHTIVQMHDISARKESEQILQKQKDELRATYEQLAATGEELRGQYDILAKNEKVLRENEEKFRTFMDASIDGVVLIDSNGTILAWNPAAGQIFGIPAADALGSKIVDLQLRLVVPEHQNPARIEELRSRFTTSWPTVFSGKGPHLIEVEVMNARGSRMTVQQTLFPIQTSSGKRIGCIMRDITGQRNAEKNLRESEARYRELSELLPLMVFEMDLAFRITYANQKTLTTMGLTDKDLEAGMSALSFIDPVQRENIRKNVEKVLRGEAVVNHEYIAARRDGSRFPAVIYASPFNRSGKPAGFRGVVIDITEQKRGEDALRESEQRLNLTIESANLGIWDLNIVTHNQIHNRKWLEMLGYSIEETDKSFDWWQERIHPDDMQGVIERCENHFNGKTEFFDATYRMKHRDGSWRWIHTHGTVVSRDTDGQPIRMIGINQDITERTQSQKALEQAKKKLNLLNYVTFNDLQNLMFTLLGYQHLVKEKVGIDPGSHLMEKQDEIIDRISQSLKFAQSYQDLGIKPPQWQNVSQEFLIAFSHRDFMKIQHTILLDGLEIFADLLLEQVFQILAENTLEHGKTATQVRIGYTQGTEILMLFFEDDGVGIPEDLKNKIFSANFKKKKGLGLYLAREILEITGISIRETGTPGKGARFEIILPKGFYRFA